MDKQAKDGITDQQYEIMLNYITENQRMLSRKFDESFNPMDKEEHWSNLTKRLNEADPNNSKTPEKLREVWKRRKSNVRTKAKKYGERGLSPQEKRLYRLTEMSQKSDPGCAPKEVPNPDVSSHKQKADTTSPLNPIDSDDSNAGPLIQNADTTSPLKPIDLDDSNASIDESFEKTPAREKPQTSREGIESNQFVERNIGLNREAECRIADELKKWRELDEQKMKIFQQMAEGQVEIQNALLQIGEKLDKILTKRENIG